MARRSMRESRSLTIEQVRCGTSLNALVTVHDFGQIHTSVAVRRTFSTANGRVLCDYDLGNDKPECGGRRTCPE